MEAKQWNVRIDLTEDGDDTHARATLALKNHEELVGAGHARRNPADPSVPEIGDELAVSRALADLAHKVAAVTQHDISEVAAAGAPARSW